MGAARFHSQQCCTRRAGRECERDCASRWVDANPAMDPFAWRACGHDRLRHAVETRSQCAAPPEPGADAAAAGEHQFHAIAKLVRHHHAQRRPLRAASFRHAGGGSGTASADDSRPRQAAADADDGRRDAFPVGLADPFHRMRRQRWHGVGQRCRANGAIHARHDRVQRIHRSVAVDPARRGGLRSLQRQVRTG